MNGSVKSIFQFQTDRLVEWKFETKEYLKAFYLDKDHYHDPIDIESINTVYSPKYGYLLLDASSKLRGGEGNVYHTYHNLMCKLFRGHHQNYFNHKKIIDMLSIEINNTFIIWPKDMVYFNNTFVGFVMDEVKGSVTLDDLRDTGFNGYRVLDRFKLALAFLKHVSYLHQKNIIIGDIKLPNVLVKSPEELFIIDTGSFQVFDYPCTVFTKEYTNKQYTSDSLKKQLRDVEDEYYAVNKVIFELMMLKGPHYSPDSIEIDLDSLIRPFTYKLKPPRSANNLFAHEQIWFGLSERMREYFYYFFVKGTITYLEDWIQELSSYIRSAEASI
jgi:serine/threonine protein kinase